MSSYSTTLVETPSDSLLSTIINDVSNHNPDAMETVSDSWVSTPMIEKERSRKKQRRIASLNHDSVEHFSPAAVSKPIDIPGAQQPVCMPSRIPRLPRDHPFTDHKVHCYKDDVTDYCRRDNNGWEFLRQKRRKSIASQVGKILDGSWELIACGRTQYRQKKDLEAQESEFEEIERYLNGETDLLGYLQEVREEIDDDEEEEEEEEEGEEH